MAQGRKYDGLEAFVDDGKLSAQKIADHYGVTQQQVDHVIRQRGLHEQWKVARKTYKERRHNAEQSLAETLFRVTYEKSEGDQASQHALHYHFTNQRGKLRDFEYLSRFLLRYFTALEAGEKKSLEELADGLDLSHTSGGKILNFEGLEPLYGARFIRRLKKNEHAFIQWAEYNADLLPLSYLSERTGIPAHNFTKARPPKSTSKFHKSIKLHEALDAGFSKQEAIEYADIRGEAEYQERLGHRNRMHAEIVRLEEIIKYFNLLIE